VRFAGGNYEGLEWIKVTLLNKIINPRLPQLAGNIFIIRVPNFHGKVLGFPYFACINTDFLVLENMHVLNQ
jgi:hypothetical protein